MKLRVILPKCEVEIEAEKDTQVFEQFARAVEVFSEECCGECGSPDIVPVTRKSPDTKFTFYEWHCKKCRARLALGQQEGGVLFPKRRLKPNGAPCKPGEEGEYRNAGWSQYRGQPGEDDGHEEPHKESPPAKPAPTRRPAR